MRKSELKKVKSSKLSNFENIFYLFNSNIKKVYNLKAKRNLQYNTKYEDE